MSSLAQFTVLIVAVLSITVMYGLYRLSGYPDCFDNDYFDKEE